MLPSQFLHVSQLPPRVQFCVGAGMSDSLDDVAKLRFTLDSFGAPDPFLGKADPPADIVAALAWQSARSAGQVMREREAIVAGLEAQADSLRASGACARCGYGPFSHLRGRSAFLSLVLRRWLGESDAAVRVLAKNVHGPLMELLGGKSCADLFKHGAGLFDDGSEDALRSQCCADNQELFKSLREDENSAELHRLTLEDHRLDRMSCPLPSADCDLSQIRLVPRFAVEQGMREDGTVKVRPVDNFSWSQRGATAGKRKRAEIKAASINGHFALPATVSHDHLDDLFASMKLFKQQTGEVPGLWKADVDAAFRRIPLRADHKWAAGITYVHDGVTYVASHHGMPFGATSSVYAWHCVGEFLAHVARRVLFLPVHRYVDDFFAVERCVHCCVIARSMCLRWLVLPLSAAKVWNTACSASRGLCACCSALRLLLIASWSAVARYLSWV